MAKFGLMEDPPVSPTRGNPEYIYIYIYNIIVYINAYIIYKHVLDATNVIHAKYFHIDSMAKIKQTHDNTVNKLSLMHMWTSQQKLVNCIIYWKSSIWCVTKFHVLKTKKYLSNQTNINETFNMVCLIPIWYPPSIFYSNIFTLDISIQLDVWTFNPTLHGLFGRAPYMGAWDAPLFFLVNYILYGTLVVTCKYIPINQVCMTILGPLRFPLMGLWRPFGSFWAKTTSF